MPGDYPLVLGIDTCLMALSVAVVRGPQVLARLSTPGVRDHAERLPGVIARVIEEAGTALTALERIAVTAGPGGFSGLRVGLSHARGMALVLKIPVIGIGTLEALAAGCRADGPVIATIDARRGEIYYQAFDTGRVPLGSPRAQSPQAAAADLAEHSALFGGTDASTIVGTIVGSGRKLLLDALPGAWRARDGGTDFPDAADVACLAAGRTMADFPPTPIYIRPPDAKLPAATASQTTR